MRLINAQTLQLCSFADPDKVPPYAILSHRWGETNEEVTFADWQDLGTASVKPGYAKIWHACEQALAHGLEWLWVDTNCINKTNQAETEEEINSMFRYYNDANICFACLVDVHLSSSHRPFASQLRKSKWFKRGWTLQELLVPTYLTFFDSDWKIIGRKDSEQIQLISEITNIAPRYLESPANLSEASVAQKMSWLAPRKTRKPEDMAYCMLGIFDVSMFLRYGEGGDKAFMRLQQTILDTTNDFTIFCWTYHSSVPWEWANFLAPSPVLFAKSGNLAKSTLDYVDRARRTPTWRKTQAGLEINLPTVYGRGVLFIILPVAIRSRDSNRADDPYQLVCIHCAFIKTPEFGYGDITEMQHVRRLPFPSHPLRVSPGQGLNHKDRLCWQPLLLTQHQQPYQDIYVLERTLWQQPPQTQIYFFLSVRSPRTLIRGSFNRMLPLRMKQWASGVMAGTELITLELVSKFSAKVRQAYLFYGAQWNGQKLKLCCQLFRSVKGRLLSSREHKRILKDLEQRLATDDVLHKENYCKALKMSIRVDCSREVCQDGAWKGYGLLHICEGEDFSGINRGGFVVPRLQ